MIEATAPTYAPFAFFVVTQSIVRWFLKNGLRRLAWL